MPAKEDLFLSNQEVSHLAMPLTVNPSHDHSEIRSLNLIDLPPEIHLHIATFIEPLFEKGLQQSCRYFRHIISGSNPTHQDFLDAELTPFFRQQGLLAYAHHVTFHHSSEFVLLWPFEKPGFAKGRMCFASWIRTDEFLGMALDCSALQAYNSLDLNHMGRELGSA